ncbi:hypothetical protein IHC92_11505 [Photobacterium damselae subsp. damselae]|uniref:hypothetical protein n=1 Tax=Photobacterium damselae TaxID=38293 RepID=UPI001F3DBACE|nr:hypothetical protein [Photobacterium damselae]UKA05759.1 hypothetical protein IHC90_11500 [Photobacterium damselae subsp. damselae]UKA20865.1 hypothetical protein IHC92_11505 [Photobacterium damselae subsp. damselae]
MRLNSYTPPTEGYFEMFGQQERRNECNNPYIVTVAFVELLDGKVVSVEPTALQFIDD